MSYDLTMFVRERGADPRSTLERLCNTSMLDDLTEVERARMRLVAAILRSACPLLDEFETDQFIELSSLEPGFGAQITVYRQTVDFTLPDWWESAAEADGWFQKVWNCARALMKEDSYVVYDHQLGRVLNVGRDGAQVVAKYIQETDHLRKSLGRGALSEPTKPSRPWWKFWGA